MHPKPKGRLYINNNKQLYFIKGEMKNEENRRIIHYCQSKGNQGKGEIPFKGER
jgi:hypothetical protein